MKFKDKPIADAAKTAQAETAVANDPRYEQQRALEVTRNTPPPWIETAGGRIDLVKPVIKLQGSYWSDQTGDMQSLLKPERAYIAHGILVVEELGLWFPLSAIHHGKKT